jgi:elongation factor P
MYQASDLRKGLRIKLDGDPHILTEFNFVKPGKGQALYRCKLKNMVSGAQFERTFRSVDTFEAADLQQKKMQFLYEEDGKYCFMDNENYEQVFLSADQVGDARNFLIENIEVEVLFFGDRALDITLPNSIDVIVTKAEPWAKGDSVSGTPSRYHSDRLCPPSPALYRRRGENPGRYPFRRIPHPGEGLT